MNSAPVPPANGFAPPCGDCPTRQAKLHPERRKHPKIRAIVDHPVFVAIIVGLILLSVVLILVETFGGLTPEANFDIEIVNDVITMIFVVELLMRWLVSQTTGHFFRRHWIDVLAVLPLLRVFRLGRVFQLVRIVRVFSLATVLQRRLAVFGAILEGRTLEYAVILSFMFFAVIFGGVGFSQYEVGLDAELKTPGDALWKSLFTLLSGEYASYPASLGGKIVFAIMLLFGMGTFAMLTGTFSALMIQKLKENAMQRTANPEDLNGHIIICGFSAKIAILVAEFSSEPKLAETDILIVSQLADINELRSKRVRTDRLTIMKEDFTQMDTLLRAGIKRARTAIILSEHGENRSTQDIDARTILCGLTIERLNPGIHTSAELYNAEYADHLTTAGVEDVVIQGDVSGRLLARVAMQQGLLGFFRDLLTNQSGNGLTFMPVPEKLVGADVEEALGTLRKDRDAILVAVKPEDEPLIVNPRGRKLEKDDQLLLILPIA
ncbi:MAG TPA: ion transporter [Candidatus Ozemobacteraceae bacterium]|nr:ion transporter [Candidatus Ozemobacteraceae bacterium]HQG28344.1 ion transporter [Candidatus Ozemobacteraceae bacterium]